MESGHRSPTLTPTITGATLAATALHAVAVCDRRAVHAPSAQQIRRPDPDDVFANENDDFVWIDLERMLAGREAARRLHPSFKG